jgi:hypothetical protein
MAQIPVFQDSQILQPSSPVAIGNANVGAETALASMGKEIFEFGNELDKNQKKLREQSREYLTTVAAEEFETRLRDFNQKELFTGKKKDLTGGESVAASKEYADKLKQDLARQFGFDPETSIKFLAKTGAKFNELTPSLYAESQKIAAKNFETAKQMVLQTSIEKVFKNPAKLEEELVRIESSYANQPDSLFPEESMKKDRKALVEGIYNRYMLEGEPVSYARAQNLLNKMVGVFDTDEFAQKTKALKSARAEYYNEQAQKEALQEKELKEQIKRNQTVIAADFLKQKVEAGTNPVKQAKVNEAIITAGIIGSVDPAQGIDMETAKSLEKYVPAAVSLSDQTQEAEILNRAFITGNYYKEMQNSKSLRRKGMLSPATDVRIQEELGRRLEFMRNKRGDTRLDLGRATLDNLLKAIDANENLTPIQKVLGKDEAYRDMMRKIEDGNATIPNALELSKVVSERLGGVAIISNSDTSAAMQNKYRTKEDLTGELYRTRDAYLKTRPGSPENKRLLEKMQNLKLRIQRAQEDKAVQGETKNEPTGNTRGLRRQ